MIVLTRDLLENKSVADWVLYKLDGGIDHVLIDEAQDTSPNQWAIVKAVTEEFFNGLGAADKVRTVLPWVTANSRFTVFRGPIRGNLKICGGILRQRFQILMK